MLLENLSLGLFVGFTALLIASIWDIKTREVPDWLSYALIFFAVGYSLILSVYHKNVWFTINAVAGLLLGLGLGLLMFYTGQWGGGDSKLIIGIAAIFGFALPGVSELHSNQEIIIFVIYTIFVGAIYGFLYSAFLAITNFKQCSIEASKGLKSKSMMYARIILVLFVGFSLCYYMITTTLESILIFTASIAAIILFYIWIMIRTVEKVCMIKKAKTSELTEGDWIVEPVIKRNKLILQPTKTGVSPEDIVLLKKNKIEEVTIKIGIPFVPSFLIAYLMTIFFAKWIISLIF